MIPGPRTTETRTLPLPSSQFGETAPPADGSTQPCPSCNGGGYQYIGGAEEGEVRCHDCFGSGIQGDGFCA